MLFSLTVVPLRERNLDSDSKFVYVHW